MEYMEDHEIEKYNELIENQEMILYILEFNKAWERERETLLRTMAGMNPLEKDSLLKEYLWEFVKEY